MAIIMQDLQIAATLYLKCTQNLWAHVRCNTSMNGQINGQKGNRSQFIFHQCVKILLPARFRRHHSCSLLSYASSWLFHIASLSKRQQCYYDPQFHSSLEPVCMLFINTCLYLKRLFSFAPSVLHVHLLNVGYIIASGTNHNTVFQ